MKCKHLKEIYECEECLNKKHKKEDKILENIETLKPYEVVYSEKQKQIYRDMKEKQILLNSISPKLIDYRERIKKEISELQKKINALNNV